MKNSIRSFFKRYEVSWEIFMVVLAVVYVVNAFVIHLNRLPSNIIVTLDMVEVGITALFVLEFGIRLTVAPSKKAHMKEHWLDLVALLPALRWFRITAIARLVSLLRLARVARVFSSLDRLEVSFVRFAELNGLQWMLLILTGIMLTSSAFLYFFERPVNPEIKTYWDALYAALVTWTTPGYGEITPITTSGRVCGLVLIVSGLLTWGILIANLAAFLSTRNIMRKASDPAVIDALNKLGRLDELSYMELISLQGAMNSILDRKIAENENNPNLP